MHIKAPASVFRRPSTDNNTLLAMRILSFLVTLWVPFFPPLIRSIMIYICHCNKILSASLITSLILTKKNDL